MLRVGQMLYGFCEGYFDKDSYEDKRVEAIGADWVVVRLPNGKIDFYEGDPERLLKYTDPKLSTNE